MDGSVEGGKCGGREVWREGSVEGGKCGGREVWKQGKETLCSTDVWVVWSGITEAFVF